MVQIQLRQKEPDLVVWVIGDSNTLLKGTLEPDILIWDEKYDFILVPNNRSSMPVHLIDLLAQGHHRLGIFHINPSMGLGETTEVLVLAALTYSG